MEAKPSADRQRRAFSCGLVCAAGIAAIPGVTLANTAVPTYRVNSPTGRSAAISGVWMGFVLEIGSGTYAPQPRWRTFFDDGVAYESLPNGGLVNFDRDAVRRAPGLSVSWDTYTFSGTSGQTRRDGTPATWPLQLIKPDQLKIGGDTYYRCASVDGLRLEGAWTSYANPDDPALDRLPLGQRPVIHFGRDGRFRDDGLFAAFIRSGGNDSPGAGQYEMRDFTLLLRYDDGRTRQESINGFLGASLAQQDAKMYLRRSLLSKRARP